MFGRRRFDFPLAGSDLFAGVSSRELRMAQMLLSPVRVGPGRVLLRQGARGDQFLVVADGHISVTADHGDGPEALGVVGPVGVLGEMSVLHGGPQTATATTLTDTTLYAATPQEAFALFAEVPAFGARVREIADDRSRRNVARGVARRVARDGALGVSYADR